MGFNSRFKGFNKQEVTATWTKLHAEFHNVYSLPNIIFSLFILAVFFKCFRKFCRMQSIHSQSLLYVYIYYMLHGRHVSASLFWAIFRSIGCFAPCNASCDRLIFKLDSPITTGIAWSKTTVGPEDGLK